MPAITETVEAIVTDNADPLKLGRIKIKSRALLAEGIEWPDWIDGCFPGPGWFFPPQIGDVVEVELVVGHDDDDTPGEGSILHPRPRWRCTSYADASDFPEKFKTGYPDRMGLVTSSGQAFIFDEGAGLFALVSTKLRLGSESAAEPLVLGNVLKAVLGSLIDAIIGHLHTGVTSGPGTSGPPDPATIGTLNGLKASPINDGAMLSDVATTEKGQP